MSVCAEPDAEVRSVPATRLQAWPAIKDVLLTLLTALLCCAAVVLLEMERASRNKPNLTTKAASVVYGDF